MAEDILLKYESLVEELKAHLGTPQFDKLFKSKTASLTKPEQFLIKMEMSRLSQPVARFIDLRGQVTGQVKPYEYKAPRWLHPCRLRSGNEYRKQSPRNAKKSRWTSFNWR